MRLLAFGLVLLLAPGASGCFIDWTPKTGLVVEPPRTYNEIRTDVAKLVYCYETSTGVNVFAHDVAPCPLQESVETAVESIVKDTEHDAAFLGVDGWTLVYTPFRFSSGEVRWAAGITDPQNRTIVVNYGSWVRTTRHEFFHVILLREGVRELADHGDQRWCRLRLHSEEVHVKRCNGIPYY